MDTVVIVPIVIGTTGEKLKNLKNNLTQPGLSWEIYKNLEKSDLLYTYSIVRGVICSQEECF